MLGNYYRIVDPQVAAGYPDIPSEALDENQWVVWLAHHYRIPLSVAEQHFLSMRDTWRYLSRCEFSSPLLLWKQR